MIPHKAVNICQAACTTLLFVGACLCLGMSALAQERLAQPEVILHKVIADPGFKPEQVFFFVEFGNGEASRLRGVLVPLRPMQDGALRWAAGTLLKMPGGQKKLSYSLLLAGGNNSYAFIPPESLSVESLRSDNLDALNELKQQLAQKKEGLGSWRLQIGAQEESLKRLQDDADVIGDIGRIVDLQDELKRLASETENLERDIETLNKFFALARNHPVPKNYVRRELELTGQLSELADAARKTEALEPSRKSEVAYDLQRKLAIVEATRLDDYDQMQEHLIVLRRRRMELEKRFGSADRLPPAETAPENFDVNAPL